MPKKIILTSKAPQPIGPYSQAVKAGRLLFCSGQIPLNPESGQVESLNVKEQTRLAMENVYAVLLAANYDWDNVVKTTLFLKSMNDFPTVNEVYSSFFKTEPPARTTVEVSRLPKDVLIEIEVIASSED